MRCRCNDILQIEANYVRNLIRLTETMFHFLGLTVQIMFNIRRSIRYTAISIKVPLTRNINKRVDHPQSLHMWEAVLK